MATTEPKKTSITGYSIDLGDDWHPLPLGALSEAEVIDWATDLALELLPQQGPTLVDLSQHVFDLRERCIEMEIPDLAGALWIPFPETGVSTALMTMFSAPLEEGDTPESLQAELAAEQGADYGDGSRVLLVETWNGETEIGRFVGARHLISNPEGDEPQGLLEERIMYLVFPPDGGQMLELFFTAENMIAFVNGREQTENLLEHLRVERAIV